jgi:hypothetical protein
MWGGHIFPTTELLTSSTVWPHVLAISALWSNPCAPHPCSFDLVCKFYVWPVWTSPLSHNRTNPPSLAKPALGAATRAAQRCLDLHKSQRLGTLWTLRYSSFIECGRGDFAPPCICFVGPLAWWNYTSKHGLSWNITLIYTDIALFDLFVSLCHWISRTGLLLTMQEKWTNRKVKRTIVCTWWYVPIVDGETIVLVVEPSQHQKTWKWPLSCLANGVCLGSLPRAIPVRQPLSAFRQGGATASAWAVLEFGTISNGFKW